MRAREYHIWWKASRIGLGHPLEKDNFAEIAEHLSPVGAAIVIAIHMIPSQSTCEKDYLISNEKADWTERWSAALRQLGADRLAEFVAASVGVDHIDRAAKSIPPDEQAKLMSQGMNIFDAWKAAARYYFDQFDIETHSELEALADQYAEKHAEEIAADINRFGDARPTSKAKKRSFDDDWMEAVDEKHSRQDEARRTAELEAKAKRWDRDRRRAEIQFVGEGTGADAVNDLVGCLSKAQRELGPIPAERLGPQASAFRLKLAGLIDRHRELFPDDVRPDAVELQHTKVLASVETMFVADDAAWLESLGCLSNARSEMYDPVVFAADGDVIDNQRTVYVEYVRLTGLGWEWSVPNVDLMLGPVDVPAVVGEAVRAAVAGLVNWGPQLGTQLAAALLSDFRERFLPSYSIGPIKLYKPTVKDAEVLDGVESASITVQWNPTLHRKPRIVYYFGTDWDPEHGICLEETRPGKFVLSEL